MIPSMVGKKKWGTGPAGLGMDLQLWRDFSRWIYRMWTEVCEGDLPFHRDTVVYLEGNEVAAYGTAWSEDDFVCRK